MATHRLVGSKKAAEHRRRIRAGVKRNCDKVTAAKKIAEELQRTGIVVLPREGDGHVSNS